MAMLIAAPAFPLVFFLSGLVFGPRKEKKTRDHFSPYGKHAEYERNLRDMGVTEDQIKVQLENQRRNA